MRISEDALWRIHNSEWFTSTKNKSKLTLNRNLERRHFHKSEICFPCISSYMLSYFASRPMEHSIMAILCNLALLLFCLLQTGTTTCHFLNLVCFPSLFLKAFYLWNYEFSQLSLSAMSYICQFEDSCNVRELIIFIMIIVVRFHLSWITLQLCSR